jgi:hypothetical protein
MFAVFPQSKCKASGYEEDYPGKFVRAVQNFPISRKAQTFIWKKWENTMGTKRRKLDIDSAYFRLLCSDIPRHHACAGRPMVALA